MRISLFLSQIKSICNQKNIELEEALKTVAEAGVKGIDISLYSVPFIVENKALLEENGIEINSVIAEYDFIHAYDRSLVDKIIEGCKAVGANNVHLVPGKWKADDNKDECVKALVKPLTEAVKLAKDNGIAIGIEDYNPHFSVGKSEHLLYLAENVPDLHIIFDTGNFCYLEEEVFEVYKKLKPYIKKNIHLKDRSFNGRADEKPELINGKEVYIVVPGTGDMPIKEILDDLKASGFEGGITAELFGSTDSMTDILASVEFMKQYE